MRLKKPIEAAWVMENYTAYRNTNRPESLDPAVRRRAEIFIFNRPNEEQ